MRHSVWIALLAAGCSSGGPPAPRDRDPLGAGFPSGAADAIVQDEAAVAAILAEHAKRFSEGYPLYPGDKIKFLVVGNAELSFSAHVPLEGFINFPHIGRLQLVGRTGETVRAELNRRLGDGYLVKPDASVLIEEYSKKYVYVMGAVVQPKDFELPGGRLVSLLQVISQAYGFRADAEQRAVLVFRRKDIGGTERVALAIDIVALTRTGRGADPMLVPDDIVFVPTREKIYVFGQVRAASEFLIPADQPTTITKAISMAGGFTRIAKESGVRLNRRGRDGKVVSYVVNVARILDGHPEEDVPLQPGDVIFVPESFF